MERVLYILWPDCLFAVRGNTTLIMGLIDIVAVVVILSCEFFSPDLIFFAIVDIWLPVAPVPV